jgi:hypothetical protein
MPGLSPLGLEGHPLIDLYQVVPGNGMSADARTSRTVTGKTGLSSSMTMGAVTKVIKNHRDNQVDVSCQTAVSLPT